MLSCQEILARHSEYVDGVMSAAAADNVRVHLRGCEQCARYDSVVRAGAKLITAQPVIQPDSAFLDRLHSRIEDEEYRVTMQPVSANAAAYVSVAAVLALAAWIPGMLAGDQTDDRAYEQVSEAAELDRTASEIAWHGGDGVEYNTGHMLRNEPNVTLRQTNGLGSGFAYIDQRYSPLILDAPTAPPTYARVSFTAYDAR